MFFVLGQGNAMFVPLILKLRSGIKFLSQEDFISTVKTSKSSEMDNEIFITTFAN